MSAGDTGRQARTDVLNGFVFGVSVAAFVALTLAGKPTDGLFILVGPVISALFVTSALKPQLTRVEQQTNGQLRDVIRNETRAALDEHAAGVPADTEPAPVDDRR